VKNFLNHIATNKPANPFLRLFVLCLLSPPRPGDWHYKQPKPYRGESAFGNFMGWVGMLFLAGLLLSWLAVTVAPAIDAWLKTPPTCSYRAIPQDDGTFKLYRC
jgi:hypothetical protein